MAEEVWLRRKPIKLVTARRVTNGLESFGRRQEARRSLMYGKARGNGRRRFVRWCACSKPGWRRTERGQMLHQRTIETKPEAKHESERPDCLRSEMDLVI